MLPVEVGAGKLATSDVGGWDRLTPVVGSVVVGVGSVVVGVVGVGLTVIGLVVSGAGVGVSGSDRLVPVVVVVV